MEYSDLIIDTDVIVDFLRRKSDTLPEVVNQFDAHITSITLFELQMAAIRSEQQAQRFAEVSQYLAVLPFDASAAFRAAEVGRQLQQAGETIGLPDTLIAGICLAQNIPLLTRNTRHYQRIPGLQIVNTELL